jgi:hypothetical protein
MSTWFGRWFGYGLGVGAGKAIFGEQGGGDSAAAPGPIRHDTEADILAAEKRYDEDGKRIEAEAARTAKRS